MVADGGRLPTASSPSGPRAFSSCHLPRCHGTSVLWATVYALSVALPRGALATTHTWAECWAWGWQGRRWAGEATQDASSYNPCPLEALPVPDLKPSCCSLDPGLPSNLCSPPLPNTRRA